MTNTNGSFKDKPEDGVQTPPDGLHGQQEEASPRDISGWRWFAAITAILSSALLYSLGNTVVTVVQPVVVVEFNAVAKLPWLSTAYLLGGLTTLLVWGRLYSQFSAKWLYISNVILFELGSVVCGSAPNIDALIIGRVICGIGGTGLYIGVMSLVGMTTTKAERPWYMSGIGLTWGLGIVLGPIVGGAFTGSRLGWRWAFYVNVLIGAVCVPVYFWLLPGKDARPGVPIRARISEMDHAGILLQTAFFTTFVLAINWGGVVYPWRSSHIIGLFAASGALLLLLAIQQVWTLFTTTSRRMIPVQFFRSRTVLLLFAASAASGACVFVPIYFVPLFFQFTLDDAPLEAGVRLLPLMVVLVVMVLTNGRLLARVGYYSPWYTVGGILAVVGSALMYTVDGQTSTSRIYGYEAIIGCGVGMWLQASFPIVQVVVDPRDAPAATALISLAQGIGVTVALAIGNAVFLNESQDRISKLLPDVPLAEIQAAIGGKASALVDSLSPDLQAKVVGAIVASISKTYILVMVGGALVLVLSLVMKRENPFPRVSKDAQV